MSKEILIVTDFFDPHISGIVTYIKQLSFVLNKLNYKITILTIKHKKNLKNVENFNNVKIIRCKPLLKISRGFYSFELIVKYLKIYKNYDYINIHLPLTEIFPIFLFLKKNVFITYHCLPISNLFSTIIGAYFYIFGLFASVFSKKIIVLSEDYFKNILFHNFFEKKIIEIPPYIYGEYSLKQNQSNDFISIGYIGRLCKEKGLENLINASKILSRKNIKHKIYIAGDLQDERFQNYINKITSYSKNNKNIYFLGLISETEKESFYKKLDIFILPSVNSFEAFGIVQLEAMSRGIPVIASNIKGVRSIINNTGNGLLFKKNDVNDLVKKILFLNNSKFKSAKLISFDTCKLYNYEKYSEKISKIF